MGTILTTRLRSAFLERIESPNFLAAQFVAEEENFFDADKVEIDIRRDVADLAVPIVTLASGSRHIASELYQGKEFTPPIFLEEGRVSGGDITARRPGVNPYQDPNFVANAMFKTNDLFTKLKDRLTRAIEYQASQVLQTGAVSLIDNAGKVVYGLDYGQDVSLRPTNVSPWSTPGTSDPILDLGALLRTTQRRGNCRVRKAVFGATAWTNFTNSTKVKDLMLSRQMVLGEIAPTESADLQGRGANYMGALTLYGSRLELWTYDNTYKAPDTGVVTPYVDPMKVILIGDARRDILTGSIPRVVSMNPAAAEFLDPSPVKKTGPGGFGVYPWAYVKDDGSFVGIQVGARPLVVPTAIDSFGCLTTT